MSQPDWTKTLTDGLQDELLPVDDKLIVRDIKSRQYPHVPTEHNDKMGAQYQVMYYKALLDALLLSETAVNGLLPDTTFQHVFADYYGELRINVEQEMTIDFAKQIEPWWNAEWNETKCLRSLIAAWRVAVRELDLGDPISLRSGRVSDALQIRYVHWRKGYRPDRDKGDDDEPVAVAGPIRPRPKATAESILRGRTMTACQSSAPIDYQNLAMKCANLKETKAAGPTVTNVPADINIPKDEILQLGIIDFKYDASALIQQTMLVMEYWRHSRLPRGVPDASAKRCQYCAFNERCTHR